MAKEFFVKVMGVESGPLEAAELVTMAHEGRIGPDDQIRRGQSGEWRDALSVQGLFDSKSPPVASGYSKARAANPQAFQKEPREFSTAFKVTMILLLVPVTLFVGYFFFSHPNGTETGAVEKAKELVLERLKVPSKAEFIPDSIKTDHDGNGAWDVTGEVDALNTLGVPLRQKWFVGLNYEDGKWKVADVQIYGR